MLQEVNLDVKDFANFRRCLSALPDIDVIDVDIRGGVLRQKSTNKAIIFEMDLRPLISDCDIVISPLKSKLALLKGLSKGRVEITITDNDIYFSGRSAFRFTKPRLSYLLNNFMTSKELGFILKEENLVLQHIINRDTSRLMKVIADQFSTVDFQILFEDGTASITATTSAKADYSEIVSGIPLKKPIRGFSSVVTTPFLLDRDGDILFKLYSVDEDKFISKFTASIGKVALDVYYRSALISEP